jgi:hypothetical protein
MLVLLVAVEIEARKEKETGQPKQDDDSLMNESIKIDPGVETWHRRRAERAPKSKAGKTSFDIDWSEHKVIDPLFLPFTPREFAIYHFGKGRQHATDGDWRSYVEYYLISAQRYRRFLEQYDSPHKRYGLSIEKAKVACQIEKDEKFWLAGSLLRCFYPKERSRERLASLLGLVEQMQPEHFQPPKGLVWEDCLASISTTTFYANVIVPHGFRIALILWLSRSVALVQRGTDTTVYSGPIPKHLS